MKKITQNLKWLVTLLAMIVCTGAWAENVTDVLNQTFTGITGTSYTDFSGKTVSSGAVYAGNCAGGNSSIQLRSSNSNSGIVTTTSGGKVKKITVVWNSNTASGRTLNVYGKNTAYEAAADLYNNSNQGTKIGSIVCGTSTELTLSDSYEYIGFRSNNGAMYITSISIEWTTDEIVTKPAAPTISPASGATFSENLEVSISTATGCSIIYTTDGSEPTSSNGTTYSAPFTISATTTVKAVAKNANNVLSEVASASYTKLASEVTPPYSDLANGLGNFTSDGVQAASTNVWGWDTQYSCAKGTAYISGAHASESWLLSPTINLESVTGTAVVTFDHARHKSTNLNDAGCGLFVKVAGEDTWTKLDIPTWPTDYTFVNSGEIDLEAYVGQKIQLGFKYVSTSSAAGTWEINNFSVVAKKRNAGLAWSASEASATMGIDFVAPTLDNPNNLSVTYSSTNEGVATIASDGTVSIVGAGTTTISAVFVGDDTYDAKTVSYTLTVSKQDVTLSFSKTSFNIDFDDKDSFEEPTLTITPSGLTVKYASDNTKVATVDATTGDVTIVGKGTARITATFAATDIYNSKSATYTITVTGTYKKANGYYALVTDVSTLAEGDEIIIVNNESSVAMSTNQKTNNRGEISLANATWNAENTLVEITINETGDNVQALTLEASSDKWLFNTGNGYLYAASSSSNNLKTEATADNDNNAKATISISNGNATITFKGSNTRNTIFYNSSSNLFSCYASSITNQNPVQIYRKAETVDVTVTEGGALNDKFYATYSNAEKALDFSAVEGLKAYYVTSASTSALTITEASKVPAGTAVLIEGAEAKTYQVPVVTSGTDDASNNRLQVSDGNVLGDGQTIYVLGNGKNGVGFYLKKKDSAIAAGKAYLEIAAGEAKSFLSLGGDDAVAISNVEAELGTGILYNLNGQRVAAPVKGGLYIMNGKKVLVK